MATRPMLKICVFTRRIFARTQRSSGNRANSSTAGTPQLVLRIDNPAQHSSSLLAPEVTQQFNANQRVKTMKRLIVILALALEVAVAATATAAPAKSRAGQARAQAHDVETESGVGVSPDRVRALHECNARIARFRGYNALSTPTSLYKTCMADHGQPE